MSTYEPWIGPPATGSGCRARWSPGWPACGAPVTIHVLSESAIDGVINIPVCEAHAPSARVAGVYTGEHSPSFPGCVCRDTAPEPPPDTQPHTHRPEERLRLTVRAPYDQDLERRMRESRGFIPLSLDGLTHYLNGDNRALCGAGRYLSPDAQQSVICSANWRIVSCPTCRTVETR